MITDKIDIAEELKPPKKNIRNPLKAMLIYWLTIIITITLLVLIVLFA
jgi:heme/copper-type cytochrome/quinol oxidase subunit 2